MKLKYKNEMQFFYTLVNSRCWEEYEKTSIFLLCILTEGQLTLSIKSNNVNT